MIKWSELRSDSKVKSLNDNKDVYIVPAGYDLQIDTTATLSSKKTVIIEQGNLVINYNIAYQANDSLASWAFIVKKGDILINPSVTKIAGVFMVLDTGHIIGTTGGTSVKQLQVDGSLYGNSDNLINSRTYVYGDESAGKALATGVIVNYSNRALKNTPPMLTNFIEAYKQKKVAK